MWIVAGDRFAGVSPTVGSPQVDGAAYDSDHVADHCGPPHHVVDAEAPPVRVGPNASYGVEPQPHYVNLAKLPSAPPQPNGHSPTAAHPYGGDWADRRSLLDQNTEWARPSSIPSAKRARDAEGPPPKPERMSQRSNRIQRRQVSVRS